jgi:hypothetical protein
MRSIRMKPAEEAVDELQPILPRPCKQALDVIWRERVIVAERRNPPAARQADAQVVRRCA